MFHFMAAGFPGRIDTFLLFFFSCVWISGASSSKPYPPRTLRPRAADMFTYLSRDPFNQKVSLVLQASDLTLHPQIEQNELHRLKGLYNHLREHPALMDSRLAVSSRPPGLESDAEYDADMGFDESIRQPDKRIAKRKLELPLTEACPSVTEWISLNKSRDIHDNEVEVFQPNGSEEEAQLGAQVSRDQQKGYVMALVRKRPEDTFDWNWIQIPVSCNCAVSQKV